MQQIKNYTTADKRYIKLIIGLVVIIGFAAYPLLLGLENVEGSYIVYFLFLTFVYITVSQSWNLVAGYAGQISLGTHAFFGLGAYTTAIIWLHDLTKTGYYFDPVVMILSGLVPVVLAVIIGIPLLSRLRGDSFAFGTLGVGFILVVVFVKLRDITGGADGIHIPSNVYSGMMPYYYTGLLMALFATGAVYFITRSRSGLALRAIREDETSAASHGVPILRYKVIAFAAAAFLAGLGGSLYAIYLFHINPDSVMNLNWLFYPILMCVLGGNGTILGPIIGAFFATALFSYGSVYLGRIHPDLAGMHPVLSGLLIILVMKFMPGGLVGLKDRIFARR
jgi:branched-chain amino acid transport system permease protein